MSAPSRSHLTSEAAEALNLPLEDRALRMLSDRFVEHEIFTKILEYAAYFVNGPIPERRTGLIVSAESGSGKTMIGKAIWRRFQAVEATPYSAAQNPVIYITMQGAREASQIRLSLLVALGFPKPESLTGDERELRFSKLALACGLRLILIDEFQDVLMGTVRQQRLALNVIKDIMNNLPVAVIALGTPDVKHAMSADEHLATRFDKLVLPKWRADRYLANFLDAYESTLPLHEPSHLSALGTMRMLVKETNGTLTHIVRRIQRAAALAVEEGGERITAALLERAAHEFPRCLLQLSNGRR